VGMSMADLMAKQDKKTFKVTRGQEIEGEIITITDQDIILDLGTKAEGVLPKKDLTPEQTANLKTGDKLLTFVVTSESESGQVVLTLQQITSSRSGTNFARWQKFQDALKNGQTLNGKGLEVNRGGLIVESGGIRGFLPSSQVALGNAQQIEKLIGQDLSLTVIEVDPSQNRLIFSQKVTLTDEMKERLAKLKVGDKVKGEVAAILSFGIFITLSGEHKGLEGLVHVSEVSWEKTEDPGKDFKVGQEVEAKIVSVDTQTGKVNLSLRQLSDDPFKELAKKYQPDDVIKGTVTRIASQGAFLDLGDGVEGVIPSARIEADTTYEVGQSLTVIVDSVEENKRRISLSPFITTTKGLIYK
jgi:small subunit ribosomal protein S1